MANQQLFAFVHKAWPRPTARGSVRRVLLSTLPKGFCPFWKKVFDTACPRKSVRCRHDLLLLSVDSSIRIAIAISFRTQFGVHILNATEYVDVTLQSEKVGSPERQRKKINPRTG